MRVGNNIRQRKDGRWEARYEKGRDGNGRIIYGYAYGATYEEAEQKRENLTNSALKPKPMNLIIMGAGFVAKEVKAIAEDTRVFHRIDFLEDIPTNPEAIGKCSEVDRYLSDYPVGIAAVEDQMLRTVWLKRLIKIGFITPSLIHPSASVAADAEIGVGTVICAGATVAAGAKIGMGCIIYSGAVVGRRATVKNFSFVDTGQIITAHEFTERGE